MRLFKAGSIRGIVGQKIDTMLSLRLGMAIGYLVSQKIEDIYVILARDTRASSEGLQKALASGLVAMGAKVYDAGILPTPALSYLVKSRNFTFGIMVTASHNPPEYNGFKLFAGSQFNFSEEMEEKIEEYTLDKQVPQRPLTSGAYVSRDFSQEYLTHLIETASFSSAKIKVVVDCAYGSASKFASNLFKNLNVDCTIINDKYNGSNINMNCGATHPENISKEVQVWNADLGISYDGDADRIILADENGKIVNGDKILAICAKYLHIDKIVTSIACGKGLLDFAKDNQITLFLADVGENFVLEKMREENATLGAEPSGHILFSKLSPSSDGLLTSIIILNILNETKMKLSQLANEITDYPIVNYSVKVNPEALVTFKENSHINKVVEQAQKALAEKGRILMRASNTENVIRIMVEGEDENLINFLAQKIVDVIQKEYN